MKLSTLFFRVLPVVFLTVRGATGEEPETKQAAKRKAAYACEEKATGGKITTKKKTEDIIRKKQEITAEKGFGSEWCVGRPDNESRMPLLLDTSFSGKREKSTVDPRPTIGTEEETGIRKAVRKEKWKNTDQEPCCSNQPDAKGELSVLYELSEEDIAFFVKT